MSHGNDIDFNGCDEMLNESCKIKYIHNITHNLKTV